MTDEHINEAVRLMARAACLGVLAGVIVGYALGAWALLFGFAAVAADIAIQWLKPNWAIKHTP